MGLHLGYQRLVGVEGIQVGEHRITLHPARIAHLEVIGVGVHGEHRLPDLVARHAELNGVAEGLGHLGLAVDAGQAAGVAQDGLALGQDLFANQGVEAADYLVGLLQHGQLILAHRHVSGTKGGDVGGLADRVDEEAGGQAALEPFLLDLGLHRGVALQPGDTDQVEVIGRELGEGGQGTLQAEGGPGGIQADGQVVGHHLQYVVGHLGRVVAVVGERLQIGDHHELAVMVLGLDALAQGADVMADVQPAGGAVAGQYDGVVHVTLSSWVSREATKG